MTVNTANIELKLATVEDFSDVVDLAMEFSNQTPYGVLPEQSKIEELVQGFINSPTSLVLLLLKEGRPTGLLIAVVNEFLLTRDKMASEIAWYVRPEARGYGFHLRKAYEFWAEHVQKVRFIHISSLDTPAVNKYLVRLGYTPTEKAFVKEIS